MRFNPGDMIFTRDGRPGLITGRRDTGHVIFETRGEKLDKARKHGLVNGLKVEERQEFDAIIKEARQEELPENRLQKLQQKVEEMGVDPKKWALKRYLSGEMSYIMSSEGVHPQNYEIDEKIVT